MDLPALRRKYAALLELRLSREALEADGIYRLLGEAGAARRDVTRALAAEFPGALRQLETLEVAAIERRLADLDEQLERVGPRPAWIDVTLDFHATLREALAIKAWLGAHVKGRTSPADALPELIAWFRHAPERRRAPEVDEAFLIRYLRPPGGRVVSLVLRELAERHGIDEAAVTRLVFGA